MSALPPPASGTVAGSAASRRAARLAAFLYACAALFTLVTASQLPERAGDRIWAGAACAGAAAVVLLLVPWHRLPPSASLAAPLFAFVVLTFPVGYYAGATSYYLPLYTLLFTYVGLTQRRGTSLAMLPLALLSLVPVLDRSVVPLAFLVGGVVVAVLVGEVMSSLLAQQRAASTSLSALVDSVEALQGATTTREAADIVAELATTLLGADSADVLLRDVPGSTELVNVNHSRGTAAPGAVRIDVAGPGSGSSRAMSTGQLVFASDAPNDEALDQETVRRLGVASALFIPLGAHGSYEGVAVAIFRRRRRRVDQDRQRAAAVLASQAGQVLRRVRESAALQDLAASDPLTGLANRRTFFTRLAGLAPGDCLVFIDLDRFKAINDTRGHQAGDAVLRSFAVTVRDIARDSDVVARYGGEEFALLLPGTTAESAHGVLQRLRERWAVEMPGVTFSAGIAVHARRSPTETLAAADAAVYAAKDAGRNTTREAPPEPVLQDGEGVVSLDRRRRGGS